MDERTREYVRKYLQKSREDWLKKNRKKLIALPILIVAAVIITLLLLPRPITLTFVTTGRTASGNDATLHLTGRYSDYRWRNNHFEGTVTISEENGETYTFFLNSAVQETEDEMQIGRLTYNPSTLSAHLSDETEQEIFTAEGILTKEGEGDE